MAQLLTVDSAELKAFARRMKHMGDKDFRLAIRKVHRAHAGKLAKLIRIAMPKTGGTGGTVPVATKVRGYYSVAQIIGTAGTGHGGGIRKRVAAARGKTGPKHKTKRGAMSRSVVTHISTSTSEVWGGNASAPHYAVNEFGGAVWWRKQIGGERLHPQPAKRIHTAWGKQRARHGGTVGHIIPVRNRSRMFNTGVEGWFFYPTVAEHETDIVKEYDKAIRQTMTDFESKTHYFRH